MTCDALFALSEVQPRPAPDAPVEPKPKRRSVHPSVPALPWTTCPDELVTDADWVVVSSSGGQDSQAMLWTVVQRARALGMLHKVVVVHADLGRIEWAGTRELAERQAYLAGVPRFEVVRASGGDLLERVETRYRKLKAKAEREALERGEDPTTAKAAPAWPSSSARWCTPDAKRGPIHTLYTRLVAELAHLGRPVRILECIGQRAAESKQRAKLAAVEINRGASNGKRHVTTWRPIHAWSDRRVWLEISRSRLPYHPAYDWGNRRLSCVFCVLGCVSDLVNGARHVPELAAAYARTEVAVGADFKHGLSMREIIRRAAALEASEGPAARPPVGTAMAAHIGRARTSKYLARQITLYGLAA
ncbi:phosphoadenosine phosphosulfate reductase family protein [Streptomyces sp. R302]|uniref:phosphoadenosine phosphosulfate reductase domain-containing protein n=1 Tax=unclassified Streptomyces TaxID=2593676 RepID=UPI00145E4758|nr:MULTISPECIES: phosphoadenosine phosphosulfate reductase family protein [unclassified Streptomyces]NML55085.1 phosphoadenosine phosphosulfate reductase family protein [Streptomyces sp. R301]NML83885.1 phosphoadenosine phosphosulfate reductase family protein [Streptomyces sp. R302]